MGHVNSKQGVAMEKHKVECVLEWPQPTTLKGLKGFLGLTCYNKILIKGYGVISRPLNDLSKRYNFHWNYVATVAFEGLKLAITSASVLAFPEFSKEFTMETNASGGGIEVVLTHNNK